MQFFYSYVPSKEVTKCQVGGRPKGIMKKIMKYYESILVGLLASQQLQWQDHRTVEEGWGSGGPGNVEMVEDAGGVITKMPY